MTEVQLTVGSVLLKLEEGLYRIAKDPKSYCTLVVKEENGQERIIANVDHYVSGLQDYNPEKGEKGGLVIIVGREKDRHTVKVYHQNYKKLTPPVILIPLKDNEEYSLIRDFINDVFFNPERSFHWVTTDSDRPDDLLELGIPRAEIYVGFLKYLGKIEITSK